jgi:hypothetical protein
MTSLWWCTHKSYAGEKLTVLHGGDQCRDEDHQEHDCVLYQKTWDFISCRPATGIIIKEGRSDLRVVGTSTIKSGPKPRSRAQKTEEYPNQSEPGKCELQSEKNGKLYCLPRGGCRGECVLYSIPMGKPKAEPRPEKQHITPDPKRYYFCRCLEL